MPEGDYSRRLPTDWRSKIAMCDDSEFLDWVTVVSNRFISECDGLPVGFTHGDLFPDNVMITSDGNAMLLDWETASHEVLVYDLAIAVIGFMLTSHDCGPHLVRGYESMRKLSHDERSFFPTAFDYGCAVLAFHRFLRHNVLYPGTGKEAAHRQLYEWHAKQSISEIRSIIN
jgi:homoserine kinase type II